LIKLKALDFYLERTIVEENRFLRYASCKGMHFATTCRVTKKIAL